MSTADEHWAAMDVLARSPLVRAISFVPYLGVDGSFTRFSRYLDDHLAPVFAEKMVMILLSMMYRYPECVVYVEGSSEDIYEAHPELERDMDVRNFPPEQVASYIRDAVVNYWASVVLYFPDLQALVRATGNLGNDIYGGTKEFNDLLDEVVRAQGLFVHDHDNIWIDGPSPAS